MGDVLGMKKVHGITNLVGFKYPLVLGINNGPPKI